MMRKSTGSQMKSEIKEKEKGYRVVIPEAVRAAFPEGEELLVIVRPSGAIELIPQSRAVKILHDTAGLWQGRADIPADGVSYVDELRPGRRLRDLGVTDNESD
jgi:bifunctional DNA-binding transcriptional regulator/antitoxin component of YhaV-PrlF toxin-antitoxin module